MSPMTIMKTSAKQLFLPFIPRGRREQRRIRKINRRAWKCYHRGISGLLGIFYASDSGEARQAFLVQLRESGTEAAKFTDIRAVRAPEHDGKESTKRKRKG